MSEIALEFPCLLSRDLCFRSDNLISACDNFVLFFCLFLVFIRELLQFWKKRNEDIVRKFVVIMEI